MSAFREAVAALLRCLTCAGYTLRLRDDRCLPCYRDHLAATIDRDAKTDAA